MRILLLPPDSLEEIAFLREHPDFKARKFLCGLQHDELIPINSFVVITSNTWRERRSGLGRLSETVQHQGDNENKNMGSGVVYCRSGARTRRIKPGIVQVADACAKATDARFVNVKYVGYDTFDVFVAKFQHMHPLPFRTRK